MARATWIITDNRSGVQLWSKQGAAPPDVVVDQSAYEEAFALSFPDAKVTWGKGRFTVMVVSQDGTVCRVGTMVRFKIDQYIGVPDDTDLEEEQGVRMPNSGTKKDVEVITGARTIQGNDLQREANQLLGRSGIPGMKVEQGIPVPRMASDAALAAKVVPPHQGNPDAGMAEQVPACKLYPEVTTDVLTPLADTPDFQMLIKHCKAKLLKIHPQWVERLDHIPSFVSDHIATCPEGILLESIGGTVRFNGYFIVGDRVSSTLMDPETFILDPDYKTSTYLHWLLNFMFVEEGLDPSRIREEGPGPAYERLFRVALEMFEEATVLYMLETGWAPSLESPVPFGCVPGSVMNEMKSRVQFLHLKDAEYGQPTRRQGAPGIITRLWDKLARYTNLKSMATANPRFESMADSLKDLGGYSAILAGLLQECLEQHDPLNAWANKNFIVKDTK